MIKHGFVYCDQCGQPMPLDNGMQYFFDKEKDYCPKCAAELPYKLPRKKLFGTIYRFFRWFR